MEPSRFTWSTSAVSAALNSSSTWAAVPTAGGFVLDMHPIVTDYTAHLRGTGSSFAPWGGQFWPQPAFSRPLLRRRDGVKSKSRLKRRLRPKLTAPAATASLMHFAGPRHHGLQAAVVTLV